MQMARQVILEQEKAAPLKKVLPNGISNGIANGITNGITNGV